MILCYVTSVSPITSMNHSGYTNRKDNEHVSFLGAHFMGCDDTRKKNMKTSLSFITLLSQSRIPRLVVEESQRHNSIQ